MHECRSSQDSGPFLRKIAGIATAMGAFLVLGGMTPMVASAAMGEVCAECHEEVAKTFQSSYHSRIWQGQGNCESCHGPTNAHVDDPSRETVISFSRDGGRMAEELSGRCLGCHKTSAHLAMWDMGQHRRNDVTCANCHTIHVPKASVREPVVCFECHTSVKVQVRKQSRHPILEGKVNCSDCHNPHGTLANAMIKAENNNQLCYQCHPEKRGPFIWEHQPVEENCAICHAPHGSRFDKLLTQRLTNLCQDCHADSGHHDTPQDAGNAFTGSTPSHFFFARSCLNCHSLIHGSTYFERQFLTK
jgi:DmsE family decaheme c-type cytochrome